MQQRQEQIQHFLRQHGWEGATRTHVQGDASFRCYERLVLPNGKHAILMDAPPDKEDVRPFIHIGNFLRQHHFSAPEIYAQDIANGFLLLEDFGDDVYGKILAGQSPLSQQCSEYDLYEHAVDVLVNLHQVAPPTNTPPYSLSLLLQEASLLTMWYLPAFIQDKQRLEIAKEEYQEAWKQVLSHLPELPPVLLLRDYHSPNLMWLSERQGIRKVGLLDFQDAVVGSPAYDTVSLLEDARRDVAPEIANRLLEHYLQSVPAANRDAFRAAYAILGAQRNCKVIGFLTRKLYQQNNANYLSLLPRMWRYLANDFSHPATQAIKAWIDRYIPESERSIEALRARHQQQVQA